MFIYENTRVMFGFPALMICLTCLLFTVIQQRTDKRNNHIYIALIYIVFFNSLCEIGSGYTETIINESESSFFAYRSAIYAYFILHTTLSPMFYIYVTTVCGVALRQKSRRKMLCIALFLLTEIVVLTNPLTS